MKILEGMCQGSVEWLAFRKEHITGTDSGTILGLNQYQTKHQLWEEKMGLRAPKIPNAFMTRGSILEPEARRVFEKYFECKAPDCVVQSDEYDFAMASLDGYISNRQINGADVLCHKILEIKCPGRKNYEKYEQMSKSGKVDDAHYCQMQHQMMCVGCKTTHYMVYSGHNTRYFILEVSRNDDFIKNMVKKEQQFYDCMMNFEEPN